MAGGIFFVELRIGRRDVQSSAIGHRIARVEDEIEQRVLQLAGIGVGQPQIGGFRHFELEGLPQRAAEDVGHVIDDLIQIQGRRLQGLLAGESKQAFGEGRSAIHGFDAGADIVLQLRRIDEVLLKKLQAAEKNRKKVIEVMGHAPRELTHRLHFFGLAEVGPRSRGAR